MKIFSSTIILLTLCTSIRSQCVLGATEDTQAEVLNCIINCACSSVEIPGGVNLDMMGSLDLTSAGAINFSILGTGSLIFSGTGSNQSNPAEQLILASGSSLIIGDVSNTNALSQSGSPGKIRITIGASTYTGNDFPDIIANGGVSEDGVFPVQLLYFDIEKISGPYLRFTWSAIEEEMREYQIERLGVDINPLIISTIASKNDYLASYEFDYLVLDGQPLLFRLKMIDWFGKAQYSNQVEVSPIILREQLIGPNPSKDGMIQIYANILKDEGRLNIYDLAGHLLQTIKPLPQNGKIDLSFLPKGVYYLVMIGKEVSRTKLIIE